ncbi:M1 family metallopeptidase [Streptomyces sp. ODS28]|uniref:M1 family metallopeptidase n=1 Tax=Streptomyces sp. ODS28 TaxID=3136688 RepID=UPI0031E9FAAA
MVTSSAARARRSPARRRTAGCAAAAAVFALVAAALPAPHSEGVGDRLYPHLGNPGYDVQSYDIALDYGGHNTRPLQARTRIAARVTSAELPRFNLDFAGGEVRSVRVNGQPARHTRTGEDLAVTPARPLHLGEPLDIDVEHTSVPTKKGGGWVRTADGLAVAGQPDGAHRVFPGNDHPSDKALFTFRVTAPSDLTVVAGGEQQGKRRSGGRTTWTYRQPHPMATELAQVSIGRSEVLRGRGPHGLPLRHVVPKGQAEKLRPALDRTGRQIAWMERQAGPYPFGNYGVLVADATTGFALETQTLSLFEKRVFTTEGVPGWYRDSLMMHELAHQWFGDSVTPRTWGDLWLNEGHATWYEWLYGQHGGGPKAAERAKEAYEQSDGWRKKYGPPAKLHGKKGGEQLALFSPIVYDGSGLVLYALRQKIGPAAFERLEHAWTAQYRDGNVSTADFIELAGTVSGQDLSGFLKRWLYAEKTPRMPGHPDWRSL